VVAIAIAVYGLGAAGASLVTGSWTPLVGVGVLLGTAWAVVYTATPMVISEMVTDEGRAAYFGYLTGTQQVGIGAGPVVAHVLVETDLGFRGTFLAASTICMAAVALTAIVGFLTPTPVPQVHTLEEGSRPMPAPYPSGKPSGASCARRPSIRSP